MGNSRPLKMVEASALAFALVFDKAAVLRCFAVARLSRRNLLLQHYQSQVGLMDEFVVGCFCEFMDGGGLLVHTTSLAKARRLGFFSNTLAAAITSPITSSLVIMFPSCVAVSALTAEAKAVVLFLKARLPCGAGLDVPLFSEPAIASTILCNVAITIIRSICSYVSVPMAHLRQRPGRRKHSAGKKAREKSHSFTQETKKAYGSPQTLKQTVLFGRRPDKGRPAKCLRATNLVEFQFETRSDIFPLFCGLSDFPSFFVGGVRFVLWF